MRSGAADGMALTWVDFRTNSCSRRRRRFQNGALLLAPLPISALCRTTATFGIYAIVRDLLRITCKTLARASLRAAAALRARRRAGAQNCRILRRRQADLLGRRERHSPDNSCACARLLLHAHQAASLG